jgi:hypothetical protein
MRWLDDVCEEMKLCADVVLGDEDDAELYRKLPKKLDNGDDRASCEDDLATELTLRGPMLSLLFDCSPVLLSDNNGLVSLLCMKGIDCEMLFEACCVSSGNKLEEEEA